MINNYKNEYKNILKLFSSNYFSINTIHIQINIGLWAIFIFETNNRLWKDYKDTLFIMLSRKKAYQIIGAFSIMFMVW